MTISMDDAYERPQKSKRLRRMEQKAKKRRLTVGRGGRP